MALALRNVGFNVVQADSGKAALGIFEQDPNRFHLLLTDMVMPGLFGDQLATRLLEIRPGLKVIFISGNAPDALEAGFALEEGRNFLRKPYALEDLKLALEHQLQCTLIRNS